MNRHKLICQVKGWTIPIKPGINHQKRNENRIPSTCFRNNLQPAIKWLVRVARNTCLSETAAVILMCGDHFQPGVLVFAESKGRQTKDTSAWHFQWCQSQEGLSELVVYTRDGAITLNSQQAHTAAL